MKRLIILLSVANLSMLAMENVKKSYATAVNADKKIAELQATISDVKARAHALNALEFNQKMWCYHTELYDLKKINNYKSEAEKYKAELNKLIVLEVSTASKIGQEAYNLLSKQYVDATSISRSDNHNIQKCLELLPKYHDIVITPHIDNEVYNKACNDVLSVLQRLEICKKQWDSICLLEENQEFEKMALAYKTIEHLQDSPTVKSFYSTQEKTAELQAQLKTALETKYNSDFDRKYATATAFCKVALAKNTEAMKDKNKTLWYELLTLAPNKTIKAKIQATINSLLN